MTVANKKKRTLALTGAATLIVGCFLLGAYLLAPSGYLALDVNPSVEIRTNRLNQITSVTGANEDGEKLLEGYSPAGEDLDDVVEDIVDRMALGGYLTADTANQVLVTAENGSLSDKALAAVNQRIEDYLARRSLDADVLTQRIEMNERLVQEAEKHQVSAGKMRIIDRLATDGSKLSPQELADVSIYDLLAYAQENGTALKDLENQLERMDDIYEDAPTVEALEDALEQARKTGATPAATPEAPSGAPPESLWDDSHDDDWDDRYDDHDDDWDDRYDDHDDWDDRYDDDHDGDWDDRYDD